jgi:hypothetical protein
MTFLNPLVLFGLAAAAIPVILHLLNLRKLRTVDFSTLTFLKELQQTKIRRLKLRQLLLLILRTLLVIFIVLAFARPALRGTVLGSIGGNARSTLVIILDDSFSMLASDEHGELFKQAKDAALGLLDLAQGGDDVFIIKLGDLPAATVEPASRDFRALRQLITGAKVSLIRRPVSDALRLAARLLNSSSNINREIYLIGDFQQTALTDGSTGALHQAPPLYDVHTKLFLLRVGARAASNVAIDSVAIRTTILEKEKPVTVSAFVRNYGDTRLKDYVVSAFLEGSRVAQGNVQLEPYGSASVDLTFIPKRTGLLHGSVELEHDVIEADNTRSVALDVPDRLQVALVAANPSESRYVRLALLAQGTDSTLLRLSEITPAGVPRLNLNAMDVVVSTAPEALTAQDAERLRSYVAQGGGLIVFPSATGAGYGDAFSRALQLPGSRLSGDSGLRFQKVDLDHPVFATVFEQAVQANKAPSVESPTILRHVVFSTGGDGHPIITLTGGSAFLTEFLRSEGSVLVYGVAPSPSWSDFTVKGLFAPLVFRSVLYAGARGRRTQTAVVGEEPTLRVEARAVARHEGAFTFVSPDSVEELLHPVAGTAAGGAIVLTPHRLTHAGIYALSTGTTPLALVPVNVDRRESDLRTADERTLGDLWKSLGINEDRVERLSGELRASILESRFGTELWKHCVTLALLLALAEMLVARDSRKSMQPPA